MPARKRQRREPTHDWQEIQQQTLWPEQERYERLRPIVLFGQTAAERAKETGASERTLLHQAQLFEQEGMASLFHREPPRQKEAGRSLPPEMCQVIVNLKSEYPGFSLREISDICFLRFGRKLSHHTVQRVLADGPPSTVSTRRYPPYAQIADPYQRRKAIVDLHSEGWSITAIAAYLQTSRARVYEVLKRWVEEGYAGLDDRPGSAPHQPARRANMEAISEVRKLVRESPELGAFRVRAALEQIGIHLSQTTCGRLLALNRKLYGVPKPSGGAPRPRKEMPYKAHFKQKICSVDIRYIEEHNLGFPEPVYLISVLENYSRACLASKISPTQTQWDFLEVLFEAPSAFGAPSMIVSDGGGQFYSNQAMKDDHKHVQTVRSARAHETPFRSPQLTLFDLDERGWLLYWKTPEQAPPHRRRHVEGIIQLPLFEVAERQLAVGADFGHGAARSYTFLHLVEEPQINQQTEE